MTCHVCGGTMQLVEADLPFNLADRRIAVIKDLPVRRCTQCGEYVIEDEVMTHLEELLAGVDNSVELEILRYAALSA